MDAQRYLIDYFGQKSVGYCGTLEGAMEYAERFMRLLALHYVGDVVITDENDMVVATWTWVESPDGSSEPKDWEVG